MGDILVIYWWYHVWASSTTDKCLILCWLHPIFGSVWVRAPSDVGCFIHPLTVVLGRWKYFTHLNSWAIWGWFPLLTMIPGFGRTGFGRDEIYPDITYIYNIYPIHQPNNSQSYASHITEYFFGLTLEPWKLEEHHGWPSPNSNSPKSWPWRICL